MEFRDDRLNYPEFHQITSRFLRARLNLIVVAAKFHLETMEDRDQRKYSYETMDVNSV